MINMSKIGNVTCPLFLHPCVNTTRWVGKKAELLQGRSASTIVECFGVGKRTNSLAGVHFHWITVNSMVNLLVGSKAGGYCPKLRIRNK